MIKVHYRIVAVKKDRETIEYASRADTKAMTAGDTSDVNHMMEHLNQAQAELKSCGENPMDIELTPYLWDYDADEEITDTDKLRDSPDFKKFAEDNNMSEGVAVILLYSIKTQG